MPYFHLPIQSGDETILAKMNRKMKINDYLKIINYIKSNIHDCAISTDLIVGFPNETNEQFENTLKLYKKIEFDNAYTFIYSKRNNTPAAKIIDKTKIATKKIRLEKLNEMVRFYAKKNNEKFLNKILDVLVDGKSRTNAKNLTGYSPQ
jgi:tRNA-2-methylthio-N6-dimethylallyladenosine synthase